MPMNFRASSNAAFFGSSSRWIAFKKVIRCPQRCQVFKLSLCFSVNSIFIFILIIMASSSGSGNSFMQKKDPSSLIGQDAVPSRFLLFLQSLLLALLLQGSSAWLSIQPDCKYHCQSLLPLS